MKTTKEKIITAENLSTILAQARMAGQKIVLTQGTYDMVHVGHGRYLAEAKKKGDILIVGVDSDEKVKKRKGPGRPVVPEKERTEMLTYFSSVDFVIVKQLSAPKWTLIKAVRPDALVVTKETYSPEELERLKKYCGEVKVLAPMATTSTSAKIRRVQLGMVEELTARLRTKILKQLAEIVEELK